MSTPERTAYRAAWRRRRQTRDDSPDVLTAELEAHHVNPVWTDPTSDLHAWLFDCWERGVTPQRLPIEATRKAITYIPVIVRPFREVFRQLR